MGLDITVSTNVQLVKASMPADGEEWDNNLLYLTNHDFPSHSDGLVDGTYSGDFHNQFRAGSYSYYSAWRKALAAAMGYNPEYDAPGCVKPGQDFYELLWFIDCQGFVGLKTSKKLAVAFSKHRNQVKKAFEQQEHGQDHWTLYQDFQDAFEAAGDRNGVVEFH